MGVNKYKLETEDEVDVLQIDNEAVRDAQIAQLNQLRAERDEGQVQQALARITDIAGGAEGNLLAAAIDAIRARATVGEVSDAMEVHFDRYKAEHRSVSGVYGSHYEKDETWMGIGDKIQAFSEKDGRRPRVLVAKMGQDGHDRGAKVVATAFADVGFDVDLSPMFSTPEEVARQAIENDVHVVGASSLAAGHKTLVPQLIDALREQGAEDVIVIAGGVIPQQDYAFLEEHGVALIFGPGTPIPDAARKVLDAINANS